MSRCRLAGPLERQRRCRRPPAFDQRSEQAVDPELGAKLTLAALAVARDRTSAPRQSASSAAAAASSPPRIASRSPSPVIGSMNPAASPASRTPRTPAPVVSTASGPSTSPPSRGVAVEICGSCVAEGPLERGSGLRIRSGLGTRARLDRRWPAPRNRRDTDVVTAPHVHLAYVRQPADALEIGADCPASRPRGVPREAERERETRVAAVCGDDDGHSARRAVLGPAVDTPERGRAARPVYDRADHSHALLDSAAGRDRPRPAAASRGRVGMLQPSTPPGYRALTAAPSGP